MNKQGFLLIEMLTYLFLSTLLTCCLCGVATSLYTALQKQAQQLRTTLQLAVAHTQITDTLRKARSAGHTIQVIDTKHLVIDTGLQKWECYLRDQALVLKKGRTVIVLAENADIEFNRHSFYLTFTTYSAPEELTSVVRL